MNIPDKHTYKPTITNLLRNQIIDLATSEKVFLEIGCDVAYTTETLMSHFKKLVALDIDQDRIYKAITRLEERYLTHNIKFVIGTSVDIPYEYYDVVLIDANHDYSYVLADFENVLSHNKSKTYDVIFHDYGLVNSGVKQAVEDICKKYNYEYSLLGEQNNWNPLGGKIFAHEAALIHVIK